MTVSFYMIATITTIAKIVRFIELKSILAIISTSMMVKIIQRRRGREFKSSAFKETMELKWKGT